VFFKVPAVIFDFDSFSFQVPICGSAAKHAAVPKKQNARVNPIVLIFMGADRDRILIARQYLFQAEHSRWSD
jgi:hypothetical protein